MLIFSCLTVTAEAEENTAGKQTKALVKAELDATAGAMCNYIKNKISDGQSAIDSTDIKNYTLILKSGYSDENVTGELLNYIKGLIDDKDNPIRICCGNRIILIDDKDGKRYMEIKW